MAAKVTNAQIADVLDRIAELLEAEDSANPFRVRAYREGADTVRHHEQPVKRLVHEKKWDELKALPKIGDGIAAVIGEYITTGRSSLLDDLEAKSSPENEIMRVPGIGEELAQRIVHALHIQTLPQLEEAAHDGRLALVKGFGARRVEAIRTILAGLLSQSAGSRQRDRIAAAADSKSAAQNRPEIALLLAVDAEYRERAKSDELYKIAPRRFNPDNEAWLPVLKTEREGWNFTVLFSNTAQAHQLQKTDDWVVIYFERDDEEHQCTVVTETKGKLKGKRVVRGFDEANIDYYHTRSKS